MFKQFPSYPPIFTAVNLPEDKEFTLNVQFLSGGFNVLSPDFPILDVECNHPHDEDATFRVKTGVAHQLADVVLQHYPRPVGRTTFEETGIRSYIVSMVNGVAVRHHGVRLTQAEVDAKNESVKSFIKKVIQWCDDLPEVN